MTLFKKTFLVSLFILLFGSLLFLSGISKLPVTDQDEAYFAQATKQMLETGNYFSVAFQNTIRYQKPPGINWLQAISNHCLSKKPYKTIWVYRIPSFLAGILTLFLTFAFTKRFVNEKTALITTFILGSTALLVAESHLAVIDATLLAAITLQQITLGWFFLTKKSSWIMASLFWIALSTGIALKGVTPLVAILTILGLIAATKETSWLKALKPIPGVIFLLLSLFWLLLLDSNAHQNYLWMMLEKDLFPKLRGGVEHHGAPPGTFLIASIALLWPMSIHFSHTIRFAWRERKKPLITFLLAWIIPTWIFFEIMPTKLAQYVLPTFPAIAILIGQSIFYWKNKVEQHKVDFIYSCIWIVATLFIAVGSFIIYIHLFHKISIDLFLVDTVIFIFSLLALYFQNKNQLIQSTAVLCLMAMITFGCLFEYILPSLPIWQTNKIVSAIHLLEKVNTITPATPIVSIGYHEPSLVFMLGTNRVFFENNFPSNDFINRNQKIIVITKNNTPNIEPLENEYSIFRKKIITNINFNKKNNEKTYHYQIIEIDSNYSGAKI